VLLSLRRSPLPSPASVRDRLFYSLPLFTNIEDVGRRNSSFLSKTAPRSFSVDAQRPCPEYKCFLRTYRISPSPLPRKSSFSFPSCAAKLAQRPPLFFLSSDFFFSPFDRATTLPFLSFFPPFLKQRIPPFTPTRLGVEDNHFSFTGKACLLSLPPPVNPFTPCLLLILFFCLLP